MRDYELYIEELAKKYHSWSDVPIINYDVAANLFLKEIGPSYVNLEVNTSRISSLDMAKGKAYEIIRDALNDRSRKDFSEARERIEKEEPNISERLDKLMGELGEIISVLKTKE